MVRDVAETLDVLIVGAGLSGIAMGYWLQAQCPGKSYRILEARGAMGGTWDLFRYPGIRSDSDMFTLGYSFRPWTDEKSIADGGAILSYIEETAAAYGIDQQIRYHHKVVDTSFSSEDAYWTVTVERGDVGDVVTYRARFVVMCSGYYDYDEGYTPEFAGRERYLGRFVHPQFWPEDLDVSGKQVVVIGSGATAVTLVPSLAKEGAHVTMLQRSPSWVLTVPSADPLAKRLQGKVSEETRYGLVRWKNVMLSMAFYNFCRRFPNAAGKVLKKELERRVGDVVDVGTHFSPHYGPWEQRLCAVPSGDLLRALRAGNAEVVTERIDHFDETGICLQNGEHLPADIIISATGLKLKFLAGLSPEVDGQRIRVADKMAYKGLMLSDIPNMAMCFGYTNASWTLKAELACKYVCRLLNEMDARNARIVSAVGDPSVEREALIDFSSGYFERSRDEMPAQGSQAPWKVHQNYVKDMIELRFRPLGGRELVFEP